MQAAFSQLHSARHEAYSDLAAMWLVLTGSTGATTPVLTGPLGDLPMAHWLHLYLALHGHRLPASVAAACEALRWQWSQTEAVLEARLAQEVAQLRADSALLLRALQRTDVIRSKQL